MRLSTRRLLSHSEAELIKGSSRKGDAIVIDAKELGTHGRLTGEESNKIRLQRTCGRKRQTWNGKFIAAEASSGVPTALFSRRHPGAPWSPSITWL